MSFKKNINDIKKNYSLGIIGGGQLALMLTEAAKKRDLEVCVQTKSCDDPAGSKADHVIEADPLKIRGNKSLINECEKIIFENEWIKIDKLNLIGNNDIFVPSLNAIKPLVDRFSQKKLIDRMNIPCPKWISIEDFKNLSDEEINNWTFPLMAKSNKGGYDGKGNRKIKTKEDLDSFLTENYSDEWLEELKYYRANWEAKVYPWTHFRRHAGRGYYKFKQNIKNIPVVGPIIQDHYQKAKRDLKMGFKKDSREEPVINHFV